MPDKVRQIPVPPSVRAFSTLDHVDYADTFVLELGSARERTAEQWARVVLEDAPSGVRCRLQAGWSAIGLKLGGAPPDRTILGWHVCHSTPEWVLLGADSRIGMPGQLLFKCEQDALLFATFVQHDNEVARAVWAGVEPVHVPIVRRVLHQAGRRCAE